MNKFLENNFLSSKPIISPPWCNCIGYQSIKSFLAANKICACVHLRPKSGSLDVCLRRCLHSATKERKWMRCCISPPYSFHRDSFSNRPGTLLGPFWREIETTYYPSISISNLKNPTMEPKIDRNRFNGGKITFPAKLFIAEECGREDVRGDNSRNWQVS